MMIQIHGLAGHANIDPALRRPLIEDERKRDRPEIRRVVSVLGLDEGSWG
jgi:hypothetical protein